MRRTLSSARRLLDPEVSGQLPGDLVQQLRSELEAAVARAREIGEERVESYLSGLDLEELEDELSALKLESKALANRARRGLISADELRRQRADLARRRVAAERALAQIELAAEFAEVLEDEERLISWFSDLQQRHPNMQHEFSA